MKEREVQILSLIQEKRTVSRQEIGEKIGLSTSPATLKRIIQKMAEGGWILPQGKGKATTYTPSPKLELVFPIDLNTYFEKEQDERKIKERFEFELFKKLDSTEIFSEKEQIFLDNLHQTFQRRTKDLSPSEYQKEMERLAIDLSWKSSQIEGNTYSLLETEILLKEKKTASGKTKEEAAMLLNHKEAIDFLVENEDYVSNLTIKIIEELHSLLTKELGIDRNIRNRRVGITGTNYLPLDNQFEIREALEKTCDLVNSKQNPYEKAFLTLVLISYIQPFGDGNKRTARILSNGILLASGYCPLSFRTVDPLDYKKAMLIFYEQTNLSPMKTIFMEQVEFAVKTYF